MRARKRLLARLDERRLRWLLAAFFVALAIPTAVLIAQAYRQLGWESFRGNQVLAEDLAARIDAALAATVATEEARSFADYSFLVGVGDAAANFVQRSPLSTFPAASSPPGAVGYFQVDAEGALTTPLLPAPGSGIDAASYGIGADEAQARARVLDALRTILAENRLTQRLPPAAAAFEDDARSGAAAGGPAAAASDGAGAVAEAPPALAPAGAPSALASRRGGGDAIGTRGGGGAGAPGSPARRAPAEEFAGGAAQAASAETIRARVVDPAAGDVTVSQAAFDLRFAAERQSAASTSLDAAAREVQPEQSVRREQQAPIADTQLSKLEAQRAPRTEKSLIAEPGAAAEQAALAANEGKTVAITVGLFESELDPFALGWLDTGHLVLFRNAWRDDRRYIQGVLIEEGPFLEQTIAAAYRASSLAGTSDLVVSRRGRTLAAFSGTAVDLASASAPRPAARSASRREYPGVAAPRGLALHRARLSPPFGELELAFLVDDLVPKGGPAASLLAWTSVVLGAVLVAGFLLIYRFASSQIKLTRQQQDFVSAVSHELKTPLTAIRMYGEMLKSGWVDDAKRATYYDYIHGESERLSRLIENVLQLARLTRSTQRFERRRVAVAELLDVVRSKAATQVERAGFVLEVRNEAGDAAVDVDADCFTQIAINLVDNALKFAAAAERKVVAIACRREGGGTVLFTVRDFGPGIAKGQMRKIFELFYRPNDGLTRETAGTGIGLALVQQLTAAMGGRVDVRNCEPGAEFRVSFREHDERHAAAREAR